MRATASRIVLAEPQRTRKVACPACGPLISAALVTPPPYCPAPVGPPTAPDMPPPLPEDCPCGVFPCGNRPAPSPLCFRHLASTIAVLAHGESRRIFWTSFSSHCLYGLSFQTSPA